MKAIGEDNAYIKAKKRVENLKGFYGNLAAYIVTIPTMMLVNYLTDWSFQWFWIPLLGWGLGISIHAFTVFGQENVLGKAWEEKKIKEIMDKETKTYTNGRL
jgi:hypothetical protein